MLTWKTGVELDTIAFVLERSEGSSAEWSLKGTVPSKGGLTGDVYEYH